MKNSTMNINELKKLVTFLEKASSCTDKWESEGCKTFTSFYCNRQYDVTVEEDRYVSVDCLTEYENKISFSLLWEADTTDGVEEYGPDFTSLEKLVKYVKTRL